MKTPRQCDVYVLMRIYNDNSNPLFEINLRQALESVAKNRDKYGDRGRVRLIVFDDSGQDVHKAKLLEMLRGYGFDLKDGTLDYTNLPERKQSAYGLFYLRKQFVRKAKDGDIAIILDQDDELAQDAIRREIQFPPEYDPDQTRHRADCPVSRSPASRFPVTSG